MLSRRAELHDENINNGTYQALRHLYIWDAFSRPQNTGRDTDVSCLQSEVYYG